MVLYYSISRKLTQPNWNQPWRVKFGNILIFFKYCITYFKSTDISKIRIFNNCWIHIGHLIVSLYNACCFCLLLSRKCLLSNSIPFSPSSPPVPLTGYFLCFLCPTFPLAFSFGGAQCLSFNSLLYLLKASMATHGLPNS